MKILISDKLDDAAIELLEQRGFETDIQIKKDEATLSTAAANADGWIIRSGTTITSDLIADATQLKVIGRAGVGVDNIDIVAATQKGIAVLNTPSGNTMAAVEHSMAMLLSIARNIPFAHKSLFEDRSWERAQFTGVELYGKTIGILGLGKIGGRVAARCLGMEMNVLGFDPYLSEEQAVTMNVELIKDLGLLLGRCDFISLHLPSTENTKGLLNAARLKMCKPGVRIVNCARGSLIDEAALAESLQDGRVAGAALDVFETEPPVGSPLFNCPNLVVSPHLGASTVESQRNVGVQIAEQVADALRQGVFREAVNIPVSDWQTFTRIKPILTLVERLGCVAQQYAEGGISAVHVEYCGEDFEEIPATNNMLLKGLLQNLSSSPVNAVNAPVLAEERGVSISSTTSAEVDNYKNLVKLTVNLGQRTHRFSGTTFSDGEPRLVEIDGFEVEFFLMGVLLIFANIDRPGVIGNVGSVLGQHDINVAHFSLGRKQAGGEALGVVAVDEVIGDEVIDLISDFENMRWVRQIKLS